MTGMAQETRPAFLAPCMSELCASGPSTIVAVHRLYLRDLPDAPVDIWYLQEISMDERATRFDAANDERDGQRWRFNPVNMTDTCRVLNRGVAKRATDISTIGTKHAQVTMMKIDNEAQLHINMHLPNGGIVCRSSETLHNIEEETRALMCRTYKPKATFIAGGMNIDMHKALRDDLINDRAMTLAERLGEEGLRLHLNGHGARPKSRARGGGCGAATDLAASTSRRSRPR